MLAVGLGGVLVEVLDDVVLSPAPVDAAEAAEMLRALRGRRILDGVRGEPPADVDALVGLLVAVSEFAAAAGGALESARPEPGDRPSARSGGERGRCRHRYRCGVLVRQAA